MNEVPRGPVSDQVVTNVKRLRAERRWSLSEMSERMTATGRPMLASGLHRLEQGKRRIDVDDLTALAAVLNVSPITLLLPFTAQGSVKLTASMEVETAVAWDWYRAIRPLELPDGPADAVVAQVDFQSHAMPSGVRADHSPASAMYRRFEDRPDQQPPRDAAAGIEVLYGTGEEDDDGEHQAAP